jgi:hypothetical protein
MPELVGGGNHGGTHGTVFMGPLSPGEPVLPIDPQPKSHPLTLEYLVVVNLQFVTSIERASFGNLDLRTSRLPPRPDSQNRPFFLAGKGLPLSPSLGFLEYSHLRPQFHHRNFCRTLPLSEPQPHPIITLVDKVLQ